ncbi:MAG: gliding motility-associated C-terminal domain-containing protein [Bacteroidetes bacterium]|nr:gliding motility-associated C-terminal domain-containing protein [Bacteroidota bacterium]
MLLHLAGVSQNGTWTWISGDTLSASPGDFGVQGVPSPTNVPPALYEAAEWTDLNGNFWIFGGSNISTQNAYSDLWKFDPVSQLWTWVKGSSIPLMPGTYGVQGVPSPQNNPGYRERGCVTWVDAAGDLWLYGGSGPDINGFDGTSDELWRYQISTNEWTWMKGSGNANQLAIFGTLQVPAPTNNPPGIHETACGWTDAAGDFWMYGGEGTITPNAHDAMWRYNIATNTWTWMSGQTISPVMPNHGVLQSPSPSNTPGSRRVYAHWEDLQGKFWLYGGASFFGLCGDLWMYDPTTLVWTWMAGTPTNANFTNFTTQCTPGNEHPHAVYENRANWRDECGRLWSMTGVASDSSQNPNSPQSTSTSTLWCFDPLTNQFVWVSGPTAAGVAAHHGTQGVPSVLNRPPSLMGTVSFTGANGDFWLWGGVELYGGAAVKNTLWRYQKDPNCPRFPLLDSIAANPAVSGCAPFTAQLSSVYTANVSYFWDFGDSTTLADTAVTASASYTFQQPGVYTVTLITTSLNSCYLGADTSYLTLTVHPTPQINLGSDTTICSPPVNLLLDAGNAGASYAWSTGATSQTIQTTAAGIYSVIAFSGPNNVCSDEDSITITLPAQPDLGSDTAICAGQSLLLNPGITGSQYNWSTGDTTATLLVNTAGLYTVQIIAQPCTLSSSMTLSITPLPVVNLGSDTTLCPGDTLQLNAQNAGATYAWNNTATSQTIEVTDAGSYAVVVTAQNCSASDSVRINTMQDVDFDQTATLCGSSNALVLDAGNAGANFIWSTGETSQTITVQQAGTYWVTINAPPCILTDTVQVNGILGEGLVFVPNSFTPNADGLNDRFTASSENFTQFHLMIFNRWGELIFETFDTAGWDGTFKNEIAKGDVYVYKLSYSNICTGNQVIGKLGHVTLVR